MQNSRQPDHQSVTMMRHLGPAEAMCSLPVVLPEQQLCSYDKFGLGAPSSGEMITNTDFTKATYIVFKEQQEN